MIRIGNLMTREDGKNIDYRRVGPLHPDSPVCDTLCPACRTTIWAGQFIALVPLGPGLDGEEQKRARERRTYNAVAVPVHYSCATGFE